MTDKTTHHAEAILRAATPDAYLYENAATGEIKIRGLIERIGDRRLEGWNEHPLYTAEAILAAVREAMEPKWLPIESAPHSEHHPILVWNGVEVTGAAPWEGGWADWMHDWMDPRPTHWQPLPTPPRGE